MTTPTDIYKPEGAMLLSELKAEPQIRLGLQGFSGTGKTYASLTFPNPIVINIDRGLGAHTGRSDVIELPFWSREFCKSINPNHKTLLDLKDTMHMWLEKHGPKLTNKQTLVVDGGTGLQNAYHMWMNANPVYGANGKQNDFAPWQMKADWYAEEFERFKTFNCHVIYLSHESEKRDKPTKIGEPGEYTGKVRPLLDGKFGDQIVSHFSDWFRCSVGSKVPVEKLDDKKLALWKMSKTEFMAMQESFQCDSIYYWQTEGDELCDCKSSSLVNFPRYIPASYQSFVKYMKKAQVTV